jgi:hypothetical protein
MTQKQLEKIEQMSTATLSKASIVSRLETLRQAAACRVHKVEGDPEDIRADGQAVYESLAEVRDRANKTAK